VVLAPVLTAVLLGASPSLSDAELLERAEFSFAEGVQLRGTPARAKRHFLDAAESYAELGRRGFRNADLCRNEGNAWLLARDVPRAILAYRRGLRLAPADRGLQRSLTFAREQINYAGPGRFSRPPADDRPPWLPRVGLSGWSFVLLLGGYAVSCVLLTRWLMLRRGRLLTYSLTGFGLTAGVAALLIAATWFEARLHRHPLVVISREVPLRKGNGPSYPAREGSAVLRPGVEAWLLFRRDGWLQIELSSGEVGWVPAAVVLLDDPDEG
jgi:hypothetical protein